MGITVEVRCIVCQKDILTVDYTGKEITFYKILLQKNKVLVGRSWVSGITERPWTFIGDLKTGSPRQLKEVPEILGKLLLPVTFTDEGFAKVADQVMKFSNFM